MLLSSTPGKAYLSVCSSSITSLHKARGKGIDRGMAEEYNRIRSHSALRYRPPALEAIMPVIMPATLT